MKKLLFVFAAFIAILSLSSCKVLHLRVDHRVLFNKSGRIDINNKLKGNLGIFLNEEFIQKMPLYKKDRELWVWYFTEGLKPIFENVYVIKGLQELKRKADINVIIKPELWSWLGVSDHRVIGFKFCFLDRSGFEQFSFKIEARNTFNKSYIKNLAQVMDGIMIKLQHDIIENNEKIVGINKIE